MNAIDSLFWMAGDEDGDVNLHCRACDLGGRPVVFLTSNPTENYYEGTDTIVVRSIVAFVSAGLEHFDKHASEALTKKVGR